MGGLITRPVDVVDEGLTSTSAGGPHTEFRSDIQGLRGVAVLFVVLFHAGLGFPGGFIGVDIFFVVSGFVITRLLLRQLERDGRLSFGEFYARRARRLLPALATMSVITLAASIVLLSPTGAQQEAAKAGAATSLFAANVFFYRYGTDYFNPFYDNPFLHAWSLAVEEQIYLVVPLMLAALFALGLRLGRSRRVVGGGLVMALIGSFALNVVLVHAPNTLPIPLAEKFVFYTPFTRLWEFAAGGLLAAIEARTLRANRRLRSGLGLAGLVLVLYASLMFSEGMKFPGLPAIVPVAGTVLLIAAGTAGVSGWLLQRNSLVAVGDVSYGWYLWHWPAIVLTRAVWPGVTVLVWIAAGASLGVALVSMRLVENPIRYRTNLVGRRAIVLAATCVLVPLVAAGTVLAGAQRGWGNADLKDLTAAQERSTSESDGCDSVLRTAPCVYPGPGDQTVLLVGDSHAAALSNAAMKATLSNGADFAVWTRPGCAFSLGDRKEADCKEWSQQVFDWIEESTPDVVIVHSLTFQLSREQAEQAATAALPGSETRYVEALEGTLAQLVRAGTTVMVISDVPFFEDSELDRATLLRPRPTPGEIEERELLGITGSLRNAERAIAESYSGYWVDPVPALCPSGTCSQYIEGWVYRDGDHLTNFGAERLVPVIAENLTTALRP